MNITQKVIESQEQMLAPLGEFSLQLDCHEKRNWKLNSTNDLTVEASRENLCADHLWYRPGLWFLWLPRNPYFYPIPKSLAVRNSTSFFGGDIVSKMHWGEQANQENARFT